MNYSWYPATGSDVEQIVKLAQANFETEIDQFFNPEPITYSRNITLAVVNSFFCPNSELLKVARTPTGKVIAYTWARSDETSAWSDDHMVMIKIAHVDLTLSPRIRIQLIKDMMMMWELFAVQSNVKIICSTSIRKEQTAFLRLHEQFGYEIRGSIAYKQLNTTQATPAN
jgi:hypothetical protein